MHNHNKQNVPYGICWRGGHNSIFQCQHFLKSPVIWGQFYQHGYVQLLNVQIQKRKKGSQVKQLFALLGSAHIKIVCKQVDEIDPC